MKKAILLLFLSFSSITFAADYYVSSSGDDSNNGLSSSSPWRTITRVNTAFPSLRAGDRILFRMGDTFYGTIKTTKSGISGSPITIGAYGTGNKPIITGFTTLTGWTNEGNGIYSKIVTSEAQTNMVRIDGTQYVLGRWPDDSYNNFESFVSNVSITDNGLGDSRDWAGAEVVIRKNDWSLDRCKITDHSGDKLTYTNLGSTASPITNGYGYFIQNDLRCLTKYGEWFHNTSTGKLYIYFGSIDPSTKKIEVSTLNNLINNNGYDYVFIEDMEFRGSISHAIFLSSYSCDHNTIQNSIISFSGMDGINSLGTNTSVLNNQIISCNRAGIYSSGSSAIINSNTISNIGILPGQAHYGTYTNGIRISNNQNSVQFNIIKNIGYCGIGCTSTADVITVKNNFISNVCMVIHDGGGIYTTGAGTARLIEGNIVLKAVGNSSGTPYPNRFLARGIYLDELSSNTQVINNTVANCTEAGYFIHKANTNTFDNNVSFNNSDGIYFLNSGGSYIYKNVVKNNIFFAKAPIQLALKYYSLSEDIPSFGTASNNYYVRPIDDDDSFQTYTPGTGSRYRTLASWQSFTGQDLNSHKSPITLTDTSRIDFYYNASTSNRVITLPQPMIDVKGTKYGTSITLLPYTSAVLMVDPNPTAPAVPVFTGALISASAPAILEMSYNLTLASSIPATSAFAVTVNSATRAVSSVAISGTKVNLTLASAVAAGDVITVAYTRPSTNPIQTPSGGLAASLTAQPVTNQISVPAPVYVSSVIQNATPAVVEMTYSLALANIIPATSAFDVRANGVNRPVGSVAISGDKVRLTLTYPVIYGDLITVSYTVPSTNPIQTPAGGRAVSISTRSVTNNVIPPIPAFVSAVIENATPSVLSMTYSLNLASVIPATSAFTVHVNSTARTVNSVAISGTKVNLTLSAPVNYGDVVTVAYTKPATNPLQTTAGSQATSLTAQSVTNNRLANIPVYLSSVIEESAPTVIEITYNLSLTTIIPATTAFSVLVNSVARTVTSVNIVSGKVRLTLASRVYEGDVVLFSYTKPATNPLQTLAGGEAASISSRSVTNNTGPATPVFVSAVVENSTPLNIDITYNINLTNVIPPTSAFSVSINSSSRSISSIAIVSGKVRIILSSPVLTGDIVTLSYTKPATNPLQTVYGGIADSFTGRSVTNNCRPPVPVFVSASVENNSPSLLGITFSIDLANVVPPASAFVVMVNSVARQVTSVSVVSGKVRLILESPVEYGNTVTVSYVEPATLALQTPAGGEVTSFSSRPVTNNCLPREPVLTNASVEDASPSYVRLAYDIPLAAIVPAVSAFSVLVNSENRAVTSVGIVSGRARLALASPVLYGDIVVVTYTKPATNPLQSAAGAQAASLSGQPVTNNVEPILPDFVSAVVEDSSPGTIVVTFDMMMANVIPPASSFTVLVNTEPRAVTSVVVVSGKIQLLLASGIAYGDIITLSYSKPLENPLQSVLGGQVESFPAQSVTNKRLDPDRPDNPPVVNLITATNYFGGFVGEIDASTSYDPDGDFLIFEWTTPENVPVFKTTGPVMEFLPPVSASTKMYRFQLKVDDGRNTVTRTIDIVVAPFRPELAMARISDTEASDYYQSDYPDKAIDGNLATKWSVSGDNNWIVLKLAEPFRINHLELGFLPGSTYEYYFDIYASTDNTNWDPVMIGVSSCHFSGDRQIFEFPSYNSGIEYSFVKFVGHGNLVNEWNNLSEFRVFGTYFRNPSGENPDEEMITVYPNPASEYFNISIEEATLEPDKVKLNDFSGKIVLEDQLFAGINTIPIPSNLQSGIYIVTVLSGDLIIYTRKLIID